MSLSYHPLCLADVFVHAVVVHRLLARPIPSVSLRHGSKLTGRPGLQILHQPIDVPLKVLLLGQIDFMDLGGLPLLLQYMCAKEK
jgi:hypothetical protein